jgi:hypothetical protein
MAEKDLLILSVGVWAGITIVVGGIYVSRWWRDR